MPQKPKTLLKRGKVKTKDVSPTTSEDFLALGVDAEDAMGKHRAGAVDKSLRFADKALEYYRTGLELFPRDGDLAYNRARLELEIACHPLFVKHMDDIPQRLHNSLASHRVALILLPNNADLLFNTAQALTMLAELATEDESQSISQILDYLTEALDLQARCFELQTQQFTEGQRMLEAVHRDNDHDEDDDGGARLDNSATTAFEDSEMDQRWVSVVEPVTPTTLLETILAQLGTLTTLCSILADSSVPSDHYIADIETYFEKVNDSALTALLRAASDLATQHRTDIMLAQINFRLNHTELLFHCGRIDVAAYQSTLEDVYETITGVEACTIHTAFAKGLLAFSNAVGTNDTDMISVIRWRVLSQALQVLANAATLPDVKEEVDRLATTHMMRGDVSLLLKSLGDQPTRYAQAVSNSSQLLQNARVYYTNAMKLGSVELTDICDFRRSIAVILQQASTDADQASSSLRSSNVSLHESSTSLSPASRRPSWHLKQLQDMVEEGLVTESFASTVVNILG